MYSTYPTIKHITPAVLRMAAEQSKQTPEEYRIGTLKRVDCEIGNLLDADVAELHPDHRDAFENLQRQVQIAIGGE